MQTYGTFIAASVFQQKLKADSRKLLASNPEHRLASNLTVSSRTEKLRLGFISILLASSSFATTDLVARGGKQPAIKAVAVQEVSPKGTAAIVSSDQRARAVRASLKAALTPDPVAMGALLFCAFALRWMRSRKDQQHTAEAIAPHNGALSGAA